jgi:serine O-acetyltransferase
LSRVMHRYYSNSYQIQIPREASIGPGLYLGHATTIVISPSTIIGKNCNLSHFVNIGSNNGKAATIGDNVYIGPNSSLIEEVVIGDNVTIGAGSVVVKDIPVNATAVGNPARVINYNLPAQYIRNGIE